MRRCRRSAWRVRSETCLYRGRSQSQGVVAEANPVFAIAIPGRGLFEIWAFTLLIHRGSCALSDFRLQKLHRDLSIAGIPNRALSAESAHLV
jgi:hypothetical protein